MEHDVFFKLETVYKYSLPTHKSNTKKKNFFNLN